MPEMVPESALDRLHWLLQDKLTAGEVEELGASFNPQFHFMALLPAPALPPGEAEKVQHYFDAMVDALVPVRDSIAAYWLRGVMSRTPVSDFSLEVQFSDPYVIDTVRRSLPRELSASVIAHQRRADTTLTPETEAPMFFRDKNRQDDSAEAISAPVPAPVPAPAPVAEAAPVPAAAAPVPESPAPASPAQEFPFRVAAIAMPAPTPTVVAPEPVRTTIIAAPAPSWEPGRKKVLIAEGVTIQGGEILGCAHLAIEGEAYSTIDRCEKLEILEGGIFKGAASVAEAVISGYCTGTLLVAGTLRITRTGHVVGSIQYGRLQVEDGGAIEGDMKMPLKSSDTAATSSDNPRWLELNAKVSAA
ncbi:MAG TPA: polymer-forming cytoskeletal protein [Stellaceae bacterium]|nr:polymer-forming cytoskeletal protein [Stellaceae bacterium]